MSAIKKETTNKAVNQYQILGGKGINVSVMLKHLGSNNTALGFIGASSNLYQEIAELCFKQKIAFAIDTTKTNLIPTLQYRPLLIKPNLAELNEIFNTNYHFDNQKAVIELAQKLLAQGAQNVLVSNGKEGSILVTTTKGSYFANTASGKLVNSVGAGDSMVAGFIATYLKTTDPKISLQVATAAGGATAFSQGIGELSLVNKLKTQIKVT
ncbi:PREDICTED: 1-phosphofructokinase-like, partial [Trachymyrmex cornetzi]|uniref:1-phosphofructokinase-like n=1 Tax=Trachymyrmex cornetzi TaxID=471704 RepID=UPI00084F4CF0